MGLLQDRIIHSRAHLIQDTAIGPKSIQEGGCGVIGAAASVPIEGRHFTAALKQMRNRGNGKGGGVALLGLSSEDLGVSEEILGRDYIIQIAYLDLGVAVQVERDFIKPYFEVDAQTDINPIRDWRDCGLTVAPPQLRRYFCRIKPLVLENFAAQHEMGKGLDAAADEFVFQNTYALNKKYYSSLGEKKAFVLSHGKNMLVFKIVGYGEDVMRVYNLEQMPAHAWIGHHRYPTKGRVWHPGGAHPFIGLNDVLVHNGDFSNYHSVSEYLAQHNIYPLFLTDTEVAVYLFDLWRRVYRYPLEYLIEAMAPTTERDFFMLPEPKRRLYREIQAAHIHGSPDGPWFFIVGMTENNGAAVNLLGITDTSMLRPQVFALQEGEVKIGLVASERQAIDACLASLSEADPRFAAKADLYWNARGGSHTDGGAFIFKLRKEAGSWQFSCEDKFGNAIAAPNKKSPQASFKQMQGLAVGFGAPMALNGQGNTMASLRSACALFQENAKESQQKRIEALEALTWFLDHWHLYCANKEGRERAYVEAAVNEVCRGFPSIKEPGARGWVLIDAESAGALRRPLNSDEVLVLDGALFPAEGEGAAAALIVAAYKLGWKRVVSFDWRGQRFCGCGLGAGSDGFRVDVYGNPGDYLASGLDGAHMYVHVSAQDQVAQIMKSGKLVIYGDVGQAFMYAAKGGEVYVLGNAAGRPLINAVGKPRVVINGTCLDYLAESFMAGNPLNGGGFVVLNGLMFNAEGQSQALPTVYPGSNLLSLASGGAIYLRDPLAQVAEDQLNGGCIVAVQEEDRRAVWPYLEENERLFGIRIKEDLLKPQGQWGQIYRKVEPARNASH